MTVRPLETNKVFYSATPPEAKEVQPPTAKRTDTPLWKEKTFVPLAGTKFLGRARFAESSKVEKQLAKGEM